MEQYGNPTTYNLETVLKQNIINADFYKNDCMKLNSWSDVIDQIFYQVDHVEPWLPGNARGPSTAFCLLYRLFVLKPSEKEIRDTIDHEDSVYIRAVGFLYLRYVADPRMLWSWLGPYCGDKQDIQPSGPNGPQVTLGDFVRDLLLEQYYYETIFPRIPKKVEDDIQAGLRAAGLPTRGKGNGGCGGPDRRGADEANRRPASVKASLSVAFGQRAPNRAGTKAWKDEKVKAADGGASAGGGGGRDRARERERDRSRGSDERRGRSRSRSQDRQAPQQQQRYNKYDKYDRSDRDRDRGARDRYDPRSYDYDRRGGGGRDYGRGGEQRDYDYDRRGGGGGYDRNGRGAEAARRRSSRSRSRSPAGRPAGRDASDVFRDRAAPAGGDVRARYGDASGKLDLGPGGGGGGGGKRSVDEVFRLGGRSYR